MGASYYKTAYDGADHIALNEDFHSWAAANQVAAITQRKYEQTGEAEHHRPTCKLHAWSDSAAIWRAGRRYCNVQVTWGCRTPFQIS